MIPTPRLAALLSLSMVPALIAIAWPEAFYGAIGLDLLAIVAFLVDARRCTDEHALSLERKVEDVVSAGAPNLVRLVIHNSDGGEISGEVIDTAPAHCEANGRRARFTVPGHSRIELSYLMRPTRRGDHKFGDLHVRLKGPWGLAVRQYRYGAEQTVKAYPDLSAISGALSLARPEAESGLAQLRRALGEGREFESLREYLPGDDVRAIDWKATAKRQKPITRQYEPERNQTVMLLVDCGRHMVSRIGERTKLDYAIDAALRLARTSLDRGDQVGLCAFGAKILVYLPPRRGRAQLRAMVDGLYPLQPELTESDYAQAFGAVTSRNKRRALIATFTDILDEDSSRDVLVRTLHLRPRHLPLLIAMADGAVLGPARAIPADELAAYKRAAAKKIVRERELTIARLREAGALVVSVGATELSTAAVNQYLAIKARGLL